MERSARSAAVSHVAWWLAGTQAAMARELLAPMKAHPAPVAPLCHASGRLACVPDERAGELVCALQAHWGSLDNSK